MIWPTMVADLAHAFVRAGVNCDDVAVVRDRATPAGATVVTRQNRPPLPIQTLSVPVPEGQSWEKAVRFIVAENLRIWGTR